MKAPIFTAATSRLLLSVRALTAQILETFEGMQVPGDLPPENAAHELVDVEEKRRYCLYCGKFQTQISSVFGAHARKRCG